MRTTLQKSAITHERACPVSKFRLGAFVALLAFFGLYAPCARALDVDADDYSAGALPAGTNLALLYGQFVNRDAAYSASQRVGNGTLDSEVGILRYAHFVEIGPFIADPQFLLPFGHLQGIGDLGSLGQTTGVGDLILASTIWLYNKPESNLFFGITPVLYVPIGTYNSNNALNLGENRWKGALQAGWVMPVFVKELVLQLVGDVTFYGNNTSFGGRAQTLQQLPLVSLQSWLKYAVTPDFDLRMGATYYAGGQTKVNSTVNSDSLSTVNFKVGFAWNFAPSWNIMAVYGRDISVDNGLREANRVNLRLLKAF
ncbi:putative signal peptide [Methylocella silvestris BL2]|uniref:Putative signal peptide n=1 Tax=Methylocella silvestris (strain DSM 15510 / CIP 108128 / LMG 27833 / NCIMB 13906 / BL2) TaxID=395965 RepID=B8ESA9_METSB|nr:transporter [Methylocella silvestris]ACK52324.1 putative signal peptide [Methylocella silvestris BL2]